VHEDVEKIFTNLVVGFVQNLRVGDPSKPRTDVGPLITVEAAMEIEKRINKAVARGAELLTGGRRQGALLYPTVLRKVNDRDELVKSETFGPVIPIMTFADLDDAIGTCNSTVYGLQAGVFTKNLVLVKELSSELTWAP